MLQLINQNSSPKMSLVTAGIYCTISPALSVVVEDCSIVWVQQLQMLYHQRCCMFASQVHNACLARC